MSPPNNVNLDQRIDALEFDAPSAHDAGLAGLNGAKSRPSHPLGKSSLSDSRGGPWWHSQFNLMLCAFGLLALAAFSFIIFASAPDVNAAKNTVIAADGSTQIGKPTPVETPWDESRRAQARTDSQDILSDLLTLKKILENKGVQQWAANRYQAALDLATQGDGAYAQADFAEAITLYKQARNDMDSLQTLIPEILRTRINEGLLALNEGKSTLAKEKFNQALELDRNSISALAGLARANTLDQALELINSALDDEQLFARSDSLDDLVSAEQKFQQVLAIDDRLEQAINGLSRVSDLIVDKRYRQAMSSGFKALFDARNGTAKKAFASALKIKPGDNVANSVYRQSLASDKSATLSTLLSNAKRFEAQELWSNAISNYQVALQRDSNQITAKIGLIRSQARGDLDKRLNAIMQDPLALSRATQKQQAQLVLNDARAISKKGPVLTQQIDQLETALTQLVQTVSVSFSSDQLTEVTITKAGTRSIKLGRFDTKNLALKPGRYVLKGMRLGYRDVRQELDVLPSTTEVMSVSIQCEQPVTSSTQLSTAG